MPACILYVPACALLAASVFLRILCPVRLNGGTAGRELRGGRKSGRRRTADMAAFVCAGAASGLFLSLAQACKMRLFCFCTLGLFLAMSAYDLRERRIPNPSTLAMLALVCVGAALSLPCDMPASSRLLGALLALAPTSAAAAFTKGLGWGDVKLLALSGAMCGAGAALWVLAGSFALGAAAGIGLAIKRRDVHASFPLCPAICASAFAVLVSQGL